MLNIEVDEGEIKKLYLAKLEEHMEKLDKELLFWDTEELMRQTTLSWNTIQKEFFYDPRFPKSKLGRKWLFPAKKTKDFLLLWLDEHRH